MQCKACGFDNIEVAFEAINFPLEPVPHDGIAPNNSALPIRWACRNCGRYHFRDGSLYDGEKARAMYRGEKV